MSKIVKIDSEQLSNFKWRKCLLGVIHPEHTPLLKVDQKDTFEDLVVTAKPAQLNFKSAYVPPPSVPVRREHNPNRRPKSAKPGTDVVSEALKTIPEAKSARKNFIRTSMIAGKDLKNSLSDYKSRLLSKKSEILNKKSLISKFNQQTDQIDKMLSSKFKTTEISNTEYTNIQQEISKLRLDYESQLWKQKIIIKFLSNKEQDLDIQELDRIFAEVQLRQEKELINIQHFVLQLREITVTQSRSLVPYVRIDHISKILNQYSESNHQIREILMNFLEKVKIQLGKDGIDKDTNELLPFSVLEKTVSGIYSKWEREKSILEGFLNDIMNAFCEEFNLSKEIIVSNKPRNKRELEIKVVAEFINMYLEKLHVSIENKIRSLEKLKYSIENGKQIPKSFSDVLLSYIKLPEKPSPENNGPKNLKTSGQKSPERSKSRSKSPKSKNSSLYRKKSPEKPLKTKSNVGKSAKKYPSSHLSSIPEEEKKTSNLSISKKNPLDSITSLNQPLEDDLDDIISDLNPSKKDPYSKTPNIFNNPSLKVKNVQKNPKETFSSLKKPEKDSKGSLSSLRKVEMDSTDGLFNFRPNKVFEQKEVFASIDAPILKSSERPPIEFVYKSISDLESIRFPKKPPETRSDLINSGIQAFHPYMDKDGTIFNPQERFPNIKAADIDPLDPYFLEKMGSSSPDPDKNWYIRPHHLRSFTNHPLSVNDNPNFYKAQITSDLKDNLNADKDERDVAISHLEKVLDDLKSEIESRKRISAVNGFNNDGRLSGYLYKAVSPVVQGLNVNEKEGLVINTYESILDELRKREKDILNQKRIEEYEKNRPPQGKWFEIKSSEFTQELQRHTNSLKPKEEHRKLLNHLAIPDLY